jgi:nitrite reductase/ring-hydroxylating ferredoxin subunit
MTDTQLSQAEKIQRGAADAGKYFRQMVEFVGFTPDDAAAIRESSLVIEKYIPSIVADFYTHLLRYPPTRVFFLKPDGSLNLDYLQKRMHHLTNFWRRTASGIYDEDYARYVDYVGRAHTSHGADPNIYISERYVIGQVGFMQRAINNAIFTELHDIDHELERRANRGWNLLMMVILEMLARAYETTTQDEEDESRFAVDPTPVQELAVETYERGLGLYQSRTFKDVLVGTVDEIADGSRKIVTIDGVSIGVFHHNGEWIALRNYCLHAGGPVATGALEGDTLICPWHGFRYRVTTGELLIDPALKLDRYKLDIRGDQIFLKAPETAGSEMPQPPAETASTLKAAPSLKANEFYLDKVPAGKTHLVFLNGKAAAVYNVGGEFYATSDACTHAGGPLSEGELEGVKVTCPWHGSCFNVTDGAVLRGPAVTPVRSYRVNISGNIGSVES